MGYKSCELCKDGYIYDSDTVEVCNCREKYYEKIKLEHLGNYSNIPLYYSEEKEILNYDLSLYKGIDEVNNLKKIKKFITFFEKKYSRRNLFFSGRLGTQKSTLAKYIGIELLKKGLTVHYILADTLIKYLINADFDSFTLDECERILNVDFLIIDEFSEDKITIYKSGYQLKFLLPFLKRRMEFVRKSTLFISNSSVDNIGSFFEGAIQDLISREIKDKQMIFDDNHEEEIKDFKIKDLWD